MLVFWMIFGVASFTTLIVSWGMFFWYSASVQSGRNLIRKNGLCPDCGSPLLHRPKGTKKQPIGFKR